MLPRLNRALAVHGRIHTIPSEFIHTTHLSSFYPAWGCSLQYTRTGPRFLQERLAQGSQRS